MLTWTKKTFILNSSQESQFINKLFDVVLQPQNCNVTFQYLVGLFIKMSINDRSGLASVKKENNQNLCWNLMKNVVNNSAHLVRYE